LTSNGKEENETVRSIIKPKQKKKIFTIKKTKEESFE
jgi:hypothetical protein